MARARAAIHCPRDPIALGHDEAAAFLGISPTLFLRAVDDGLMPQPRRMFGRMLWDADEITTAFRRLPRKEGFGQDAVAGDVWDDARA